QSVAAVRDPELFALDLVLFVTAVYLDRERLRAQPIRVRGVKPLHEVPQQPAPCQRDTRRIEILAHREILPAAREPAREIVVHAIEELPVTPHRLEPAAGSELVSVGELQHR